MTDNIQTIKKLIDLLPTDLEMWKVRSIIDVIIKLNESKSDDR